MLHQDMYHQYKIEAIRRDIHTEHIWENGAVLPPHIAVRPEDGLRNDNVPGAGGAAGTLPWDGNASGDRVIECSVLSEMIVRYDRETVLSGQFDPMQEENLAYRPFFASFMIRADREIQEKIAKLEYAWYGAFFYPENKEEEYKNLFRADEVIKADAVFLFSAPSGFSLEGKLIILPGADDPAFDGMRVNDLYHIRYDVSRFLPATDEEIGEVLQGIWKKDTLRTIEIYNIGQGNANYLRGGKSRFMFDLGYPTKSVPDKHPIVYRRALLAIKQAKPSAVILSDWDSDHFAGAVFANDAIFQAKWIAPALYWEGYTGKSRTAASVGTNAYRLAAFLQKKQLLVLADWKEEARVVTSLNGQSGQVIRLEMGGSGKSDPDIAMRSRHGLYFSISGENGDTHTLLASDVPYSSMREGTTGTGLQILHVPQHCTRMNLEAIDHPFLSGLKKAVISAERGSEYDLHRIKLEQTFGSSNIVFTPEAGQDNDTLAVEIQYNAAGPLKIGKR